ncbi:MAG: hypothetical protein WC222_10265 [Parachlamydiales bacterium]|jgi:hypothetical protein
MKFDYWSCSKFADWLRGTPKIHSGTAEVMECFEKECIFEKIS